MEKLILIAGLGNPEEKFENTRHNLGFMVLDEFSQEANPKNNPFKLEEKFESLIKSYNYENQKIILVKPQTFMNNSGRAIKKIIDFYKIDLKNLIVIHDDIDLPLEKIRLSKDSSSAGHKGVESIIQLLGSQDFRRIRCGIKNEINKNIPTEKFVLQKFSEKENNKLKNILKSGSETIKALVSDNK